MILQERIKQDVLMVTLPNIFNEEDRGWDECCDAEIVMANETTLSYQNDISPAWVKLYSPSDSASFTLKKCDGTDAIYQPMLMSFPNDAYSVYCEIPWNDVYATDGVGNYYLEVDYSISSITGAYTYEQYTLKKFTIENALGTIRFRAVWNHFHEIENINFKGANVNGTIRMNGFIGNRQPNKEINNLQYANRQVKSIVRENLNTYEFTTDPIKEKFTMKLTDLYLLSEVELYVSDHNDFNHSYKYLDLPVTIEESEQFEYKELSRDAVVKGKMIDRFRNKRAIYS